jgi:hypothetical protein
MSKKSRKRNKKILAAIGIGLGAAAMASKRKKELASTEDGKGGIDTIDKAKQSMTKDNAYKLDSKKDTAVKPLAKDTSKKVNNNTFRTRGRITDSAGNTIPSETKTNYVKNAKINALNTAEGSPLIDNPYKSRPNPRGRGNFKSGGKVRGCGKALRGFGKAMKGKR